ncbi:MAG: low-density lipoprotein receptor class A repeat-containing protein, partial [Candidatus Thermoplasmatota archaeon]|nr:low-density lipoprotein receptor class A repeat-containing protein [Candidatus Thermoplasmatota archaeon]
MQENKLRYKRKASMLVLTLLLMSLSSVFTNTINAEDARSTTGAEQILVTVLSDHYDEQSSIMVGATVNGLNPGIDYDMKLTICYDITNIDDANIHFTEGMHYNNYDCSERMLDAYIYDAATDEYETYLWDEVINIPAGVNNYNIAKAIEFSKISDVHPEELGTFSCNDGSTVDDWWMVNDGNNDCLDASDEGFDYANWPTEIIDA